MTRGIYEHKPGQGFLNARHEYAVIIGEAVYHKGYARRAAVHAFKRAQKGYKGTPAPADGKVMVMTQDGTPIMRLDP